MLGIAQQTVLFIIDFYFELKSLKSYVHNKNQHIRRANVTITSCHDDFNTVDKKFTKYELISSNIT